MLRFSMTWKCRTVCGTASPFSPVVFCVLLALPSLSALAQSAPLVTTTQIRILSNGSQTTSVKANTPVQLQATITDSDNTEVTPGQVLFCDVANGTVTKGIMAACAVPIATAQTKGYSIQTSNGTSNYGQAMVTIYPLAGNHGYEAVFLGNSHYKVSASTAPLLVSGTAATATGLAVSGSSPQYTLTATVNTLGSNAATGSVAFNDTTIGEELGSVAPGKATSISSLTITSQPTVSDTGACSIASGDFNGDGIADFAVGVGSCVGPGGGNSAAPLQILLGNGDGTFAVTPIAALKNLNITAVTAGDFNNDGTVDLVAATDVAPADIGGSYTYGLLFLAGDGKGGFSSTTLSAPCTSDTYQMATADFNGDGNLDLAVNCEPTQNPAGVTKVFLGDGKGGFTAAGSVAGGGYELNSFGVADFNSDGFPDLVVMSDTAAQATVYLNDGTGNFKAGPVLSSQVDGLIVGDFNGDGNADVAIASGFTGGESLTLYPGNGSGAFGQPITTNIPNLGGGNYGFSMVAADFNGDGITDIGMISGETDAPYLGSALVLGSASGTFKVAANLQTQFTGDPEYFPGAVGDFNKDGIPDILMSSSDLNTAYGVSVGQGLTQTATLTQVHPIGTGSHNVTATYAGDSNTASSTSSPVSLTATPASTTLALTAAPTTVAIGSQVALTATLTPYSAGQLTTDGEQVTFSSGGKSIGTAALKTGEAMLNLTSLPVGTNSITAQYVGDKNFQASASSVASVTVTSAVVPVAPTLTPSTLTFSQTTVGVTSAAQSVTVQNTGTVALSISSIGASGNFAESNTCGSSLAPGASCTVNVTFSPASTGTLTGTLTITDNASPQTQTVALSGTGVAATIAITAPSLPSGGVVVPTSGTTTVNLSFTPPTGFTGGIVVSCKVNFKGTGVLHHGPICSLAPSTINVTNGAAGGATLTITTGPQNALLEHFDGSGGVALAGLLFCLCFLPRRRWRGALLVLLCTTALGFAIGCGGSGSSGTTAGSYSVTVSATAGSTTSSVDIPFAVQ